MRQLLLLWQLRKLLLREHLLLEQLLLGQLLLKQLLLEHLLPSPLLQGRLLSNYFLLGQLLLKQLLLEQLLLRYWRQLLLLSRRLVRQQVLLGEVTGKLLLRDLVVVERAAILRELLLRAQAAGHQQGLVAAYRKEQTETHCTCCRRWPIDEMSSLTVATRTQLVRIPSLQSLVCSSPLPHSQ